MKENLTEIITIHDETSAMKDYFDDALKGYRAMIGAFRKLDGETRISDYGYGKSYKVFFDNLPVEKMKIRLDREFSPNGVCAMLDSVAKTMDDVGARLSATDESERPSQIVFTIWVLGRDNASRKYTYDMVRDMIALQRDVYKWKFFLMTDFTINMEKLGIADDDTIIIRKSEKNAFTAAYKELTDKIGSFLGK